MIEIIGIRFKKAGKIYYFEPAGKKLGQGEKVIVETARGVEFGTVALANRMVKENDVVLPLKPIIRVADENDIEQERLNTLREKEAETICLEKIQKYGLPMKLIGVDLMFDQNKINFYFTADGRVDFRELARDLAAVFKMRTELWQIGVRDESKIMSGIGICGRTLCCSTFLEEFHPVSIKMAKDQNLPLNPTKISGICSRLMCCLKYEEETYEFLNQSLPNEGDIIRTADGTGEVLSVSVLRGLVRAAIRKKPSEPPAVNIYDVSEIEVIKPRLTNNSDRERLKELDMMDLT